MIVTRPLVAAAQIRLALGAARLPRTQSEPVADQLAQNAVDMLSYPEGTGSPATTPHRALQMVRENLDYLERFLGPQSGHDPGSTRPS